MENENVAEYILSEKDWVKKMEIIYYLQRKTDIFFDNTVLFKTFLAKLFIEKAQIKDVDENTLVTACLLCNCKKNNNPQDLSKVTSYAQEGARYLKTLGFDEKFCNICEGVNRYNNLEIRENESDILELVDSFGGMLMDRPERLGYKANEAIVLLEFRNFKDKDNKYLKRFIDFINTMEEVTV